MALTEIDLISLNGPSITIRDNINWINASC